MNATPAALYLRCSDPTQETSIDQQRKEVTDYAGRKGYRIVATYIDEGKSASKNDEKRVNFNRMIADVPKGEFSAVLVWHYNRFTRRDSQKAAADKVTMRETGVVLDSVQQGIADWTTSIGRITDTIRTEADSQYSQDLSVNSLRGRRHVLSLGYWPVGQVPYGYDRRYSDSSGNVFNVSRLDRTFQKGRNWHLKLTVNEAEAATVREIFTRLFSEGISYRALANDLNSRKIPSPEPKKGKGMGWNKDTVKGIVNQKAYIGVASIGGGRRLNREAHNRCERIEKDGACPAIIDDRNLWNNVHASLDRKQQDGRKPHFNKSALLSGFVVCGHCGYRMDKREKAGRVIFVCSSGSKRQHLGCRQWQVSQSAILRKTMDWLCESVDAEILKALVATPKEKDTAIEARLRKDEKRLADKVTTATESALTAPGQARAAAWAIVTKWQDELAGVQSQLQAIANARNDTALTGLADWWTEEKTHIVNALERGVDALQLTSNGLRMRTDAGKTVALAVADHHKIRELLARLGFTLKLWWTHTPEARAKDRTKSEWTLDKEEICVKVPSNRENVSADGSSTTRQSFFEFTRSRSVRT